MILALLSLMLLPSFPDQAKWMKPGQKLYLYNKLERDHGHHEQEKAHWTTLKHVASDWVFWLQGSVYCFNVGTANATAFFAPTIIEVGQFYRLGQPIREGANVYQGLGYDGLSASLRSGFPFFAALGLLMITSTLSDRYQRRATAAVFTSMLMVIGLVIMRAIAGTSSKSMQLL